MAPIIFLPKYKKPKFQSSTTPSINPNILKLRKRELTSIECLSCAKNCALHFFVY